MGITSIVRDWGNDSPAIVRILTTDTVAAASTTNYILNQEANIEAVNNGAFTWLLTDSVLVAASDGSFFATISSNFHSLIPVVFSTTVIGTPVTVGDVAIFASTSGNLEDLHIAPSNAALAHLASVGTVVANEIPTFADTTGSLQGTAYSISNALLIQPSATNITAHSGGGQASATALTKAINTVVTVAADADSVKLPAAVPGLEVTVINGNVLHSIQVFGSGTDTINGVATATGVPQLPDVTTIYSSTTAGNWITNTFPVNSVSTLISTVHLTAAQFNGMYTTPVQLVAAPGSNLMISVDKVVLQMTFGSADFAAGGVVAAQYGNSAHGAGTAATNTEAAADFFAGANTVFQFRGVSGDTVGALPTANVSNAGIFLSNDTGVFTTGDSTFVVKTYYRIVNLAGNF